MTRLAATAYGDSEFGKRKVRATYRAEASPCKAATFGFVLHEAHEPTSQIRCSGPIADTKSGSLCMTSSSCWDRRIEMPYSRFMFILVVHNNSLLGSFKL